MVLILNMGITIKKIFLGNYYPIFKNGLKNGYLINLRAIRMSKSVEQEGGAKKKRSVKAKGKSKSKTAKTTKTTKHKTSKSKSKTSKSKGKKGGAKKRYFKMIDPSSGSTIGRYTGDTPKQAASKGYTKMIHRDKKAGKRTPSGTRTKIYLRESTRNSNQKTYGYEAIRKKLKDPEEVEIKDDETDEVKKIVYRYRNEIKKIAVPEAMQGGARKKAKAKSTKSKGKGKATGKGSKGKGKGKKSGGSKTAKKKPASKSKGKGKSKSKSDSAKPTKKSSKKKAK